MKEWRDARSIPQWMPLLSAGNPREEDLQFSSTSVLQCSLLFSLYINSHVWSLFKGSENSGHHRPISICNPALDHTYFHFLLPSSSLPSFLYSCLISFFCFQSTFTLIWSWKQPQERKIVVDIILILLDKKMRLSWVMYPDHRKWHG